MVQKLKYVLIALAAYSLAAAYDYTKVYARQSKLPQKPHSSADLPLPMRELMHQHQLSGVELTKLIAETEQQKRRYKD